MNTVVASENSDLVQQMLDRASASSAPSEASVAPPEPVDLPDTSVTLPAGLESLDGTVEREAEVRELTGNDEEAIARAKGSVSKILDTLLARGVVSIGGKKPDAKTLDSLLSGDRDALVVAIRRVTFGDEMEMTIVCPGCKAEQEIALSCDRDIPKRSLLNDERVFDVTLRSGKVARVGLPDGASQRALATAADKSEARLRTMLLTHCLQEIDGFPIVREAEVMALSMRDRDTLIVEINKHNPGPQLQEVSRPCVECSEKIALPLTLADLFRF